MKPVFGMDVPSSQVLPSEFAEYQAGARRAWYLYLAFVMGLIFAAAPFFIEPARHCVEYPCPVWLRSLVGGVGVLFFAGAGYALLRNVEWGSRIDERDRAIVWWLGPPPAPEKRITIGQINVVRIDTSSDSDRLWLLDDKGNKLRLPNECLRPPLERWAEALARQFPHIRIERS